MSIATPARDCVPTARRTTCRPPSPANNAACVRRANTPIGATKCAQVRPRYRVLQAVDTYFHSHQDRGHTLSTTRRKAPAQQRRTRCARRFPAETTLVSSSVCWCSLSCWQIFNRGQLMLRYDSESVHCPSSRPSLPLHFPPHGRSLFL